MGGRTLITGGAGYIGMGLAEELLEGAHVVRVLDSLLHDQRGCADALRDADNVVHLAAIVGDPACARDPEAAQAVNIDASMALIGTRRTPVSAAS